MKISVATPTYNYGRFLQSAIESVFEQVADPAGDLEVEHLVVDGGSEDGTLDILKSWDAKVAALPEPVRARYSFRWVSEKDDGQTDAINKGLRKSTGDVVCWLNADEYYLPGRLALVAREFETHSKVDFIYGEVLFVDEDHKPIRVKRDHPFSGFVLLWYGCFIVSCCSFWRRRALEDGHYLDTSYKVVMDGEYWMRLHKNGYRFHFLPRTIAAFSWHGGNVSVLLETRRVEEIWKIRRRYSTFSGFALNKKEILFRLFRLFGIWMRRALVLFRIVVLPMEKIK